MANSVVATADSALKSLSKLAELGGYLKRETREDIQKSVSVLKNAFTEMSAEINSLKEEKRKLEIKVREGMEEACMEEEESSPSRQVAPSIVNTCEPGSGNQNTSPAGETTNQQTRLNAPVEKGGNNKEHGDIDVLKEEITKKDEMNNDIRKKVDMILEFLTHQMGADFGTTVRDERPATNEQENTSPQQERTQTTNRTTTQEKDTREDKEKEEDRTGFRTVQRRRGSRENQRDGGNFTRNTKEQEDELQAAERMAWVFIGRLKQTTSKEAIVRHLGKHGIQGNIECEELQTRGNKKAYKVGFPLHYIGKTENPEFWPEGIVVRRFRFRRRYRQHDYGEGGDFDA